MPGPVVGQSPDPAIFPPSPKHTQRTRPKVAGGADCLQHTSLVTIPSTHTHTHIGTYVRTSQYCTLLIWERLLRHPTEQLAACRPCRLVDCGAARSSSRALPRLPDGATRPGQTLLVLSITAYVCSLYLQCRHAGCCACPCLLGACSVPESVRVVGVCERCRHGALG